MARTNKILGQLNPSASTETVQYTVPGATQAVASSLTVCNRGTVSATVRIGVSPGGGTLVAGEYIVYDAVVPAKDTLFLTIGWTLGAADEVRVFASTANVDFNLFGVEIT